jgi:hypothetical protein
LLYGYHPEYIWDIEIDIPGGEVSIACQWAARIKEVHAQLAEMLKVMVEY